MLNFFLRLLPPKILFGIIFLCLSLVGSIWFVVDMSLRGLETSIGVQTSRMEAMEDHRISEHQEILRAINVNRARSSEIMVEMARLDGSMFFTQSSIDRVQGQLNGLKNSPYDENPRPSLRIEVDDGRTFVVELSSGNNPDRIIDAILQGGALNFVLDRVSENIRLGEEPNQATIERLNRILNELGQAE